MNITGLLFCFVALALRCVFSDVMSLSLFWQCLGNASLWALLLSEHLPIFSYRYQFFQCSFCNTSSVQLSERHKAASHIIINKQTKNISLSLLESQTQENHKNKGYILLRNKNTVFLKGHEDMKRDRSRSMSQEFVCGYRGHSGLQLNYFTTLHV